MPGGPVFWPATPPGDGWKCHPGSPRSRAGSINSATIRRQFPPTTYGDYVGPIYVVSRERRNSTGRVTMTTEGSINTCA